MAQLTIHKGVTFILLLILALIYSAFRIPDSKSYLQDEIANGVLLALLSLLSSITISVFANRGCELAPDCAQLLVILTPPNGSSWCSYRELEPLRGAGHDRQSRPDNIQKWRLSVCGYYSNRWDTKESPSTHNPSGRMGTRPACCVTIIAQVSYHACGTKLGSTENWRP